MTDAARIAYALGKVVRPAAACAAIEAARRNDLRPKRMTDRAPVTARERNQGAVLRRLNIRHAADFDIQTGAQGQTGAGFHPMPRPWIPRQRID